MSSVWQKISHSPHSTVYPEVNVGSFEALRNRDERSRRCRFWWTLPGWQTVIGVLCLLERCSLQSKACVRTAACPVSKGNAGMRNRRDCEVWQCVQEEVEHHVSARRFRVPSTCVRMSYNSNAFMRHSWFPAFHSFSLWEVSAKLNIADFVTFCWRDTTASCMPQILCCLDEKVSCKAPLQAEPAFVAPFWLRASASQENHAAYLTTSVSGTNVSSIAFCRRGILLNVESRLRRTQQNAGRTS